jgi:phospholipid/cholesterol/gamma-HCH transport system ATP-binding protein
VNEAKDILRVEHLSKSFDDKVILKDVSLSVREGETLAVLGKSGTGKSVLLKIVVGLLVPDGGRVIFRDKDVTNISEKELLKLRQSVGFLFQGAALFDSMTVGENLDLVLSKHTDLEPKAREERIVKALDVVGLADDIDRMPSELSGGMKKRAGLARSIVLEPDLILYDEPTTGLDPVTASSIAELIISLQKKLGIASIVVTHDLPTAYTVSDRAIVLDNGMKIFDDSMENLKSAKDPFLQEYLAVSTLDSGRRTALLEKAQRSTTVLSSEEELAHTHSH